MPMNEQGRREKIQIALADHAAGEERERITLPYQNSRDRTFPVVSLPLDSVLLNAKSHRIRSQLESDARRDLIMDEPDTDAAQEAISELLCSTEGFEDLKASLREYGQRDPGVVTTAGVLVNANTRAVALREIGERYIKVAVLPESAGQQEIDELELRLQIQRDLRQDYTFTNRLLAIEEMLGTYRFTPEDVAKQLNWAPSSDPADVQKGVKRVEQEVRMLAMIRRIQHMSDDGRTPPLTFFDDKLQILIDLDDDYEKLKRQDLEGAEQMWYTRVAGLLSNSFYRDLRKFKRPETRKHVLEAIEDEEALNEALPLLPAPQPAEAEDLPGLDLLDGETSPSVPEMAPLVGLLVKSHGREEVELPSESGGTIMSSEQLRDKVRTVVAEAATSAEADDKARKSLDGPTKLLGEAVAKMAKAAEVFRENGDNDEFDLDKYKEAVEKAVRQADALKADIEGR